MNRSNSGRNGRVVSFLPIMLLLSIGTRKLLESLVADTPTKRAYGQDVLRLNRHCTWTGLIFPQANAIVSNTRSKRNSGF